MNVQRYIEITSAHRDRTRYPNPAQFLVELSLTNNRNSSNNAKDPIYNGYMTYPPPNSAEVYNNYGYMYGVDTAGFGVSDSRVVGIVPPWSYANGVYSTIEPFSPNSTTNLNENGFIGDSIELIENVAGGVVTARNEFRTIIGYRVVPHTGQYISTTVDSAQPLFTTSIPLAGAFTGDIDNYFLGWTFEIPSTGDKRTVTYYRASDRRVFLDEPILSTIGNNAPCVLYLPMYEITLNAPFSVGALPLSNISSTDHTTYRIHSGVNLPIAYGTLVGGTQNTFTLPASVGTQDYTGSMLWITSNPVVLSGTLTSASIITSGGSQVQGTFVLGVSASGFADNFLNGMLITMNSGTYAGHSFRITDWVQSTRTGTITPGWTTATGGGSSPAGGDAYTITIQAPSNYNRINSYNPSTRVGTVAQSFTYVNEQGVQTKYALTASDTFEILQFKSDNYQPLDYAESIVAQQQPHCYEIELTSLTLPNVPQIGGTGGVIAFYPYVYVEFRNISYGTSAYDLNTNNPAARNVMFKAPIVFNYQLAQMAFIVADGHGMKQTLKFKPSDALQFSVYLPNGELFETEIDYLSPAEPNPNLQITACFSVRRMENECKF